MKYNLQAMIPRELEIIIIIIIISDDDDDDDDHVEVIPQSP